VSTSQSIESSENVRHSGYLSFGSVIALLHGMSECSTLLEQDEPRPRLVELKMSAGDIDHTRQRNKTHFLLHHFDPHQVGFGIADIVVQTSTGNEQVEE
jgi:hypothetical protein